MKKSYEQLQVEEQKETNLWLIINTAFTILAGIGSILLPAMEWWWHK